MPNITTTSILAQLEQSSILNIGVVASPEPIDSTSNGVVHGRALYDTPPPGSQPEELARSSRSRSRTERAKAGFDSEIAASKRRSSRSKRTRARNRGNPSFNHRQDQNTREATAQKSNKRGFQSNSTSIAPESMVIDSEMEDGSRAPSKSPTPLYTADEPEGQPQRDELQAKITRKFQRIIDNSGTQTLIDVDSAISIDPAYATQLEEHSTSAQFLPPITVGVGGGFHLDHPTHRPGNTKTYAKSKGRRKSLPPSRSEIELSSDNDTAPETDIDDLVLPVHLSQRIAPHIRSQPIHDPESPFYIRTRTPIRARTPFLGYPANQSPQHSHHEPDGRNARVASEPDTPPLGGIPTSSQSLGNPIATPAGQDRLSHAVPADNLRLRAERSVTHVSSSTQTLRDQVSATHAPGQCDTHERPQPNGSQRSDRASSQQGRSQLAPNGSQRSELASTQQLLQPHPRPPSQLPHSTLPDGHTRVHALTQTQGGQLPPSSATVAPARKPTATSIRPAGGKAYGTRLNLIEISSQRLPTTMRGRERSRSRAAPSSTRRKAKPTLTPRAQLSSRHQTVHEPRRPPPQDTSEDEPDLLEGFDADEHVAEFAAQGVVVPTANDLHGIERALWKPVRNVAWGFSMGRGNFQTRTVYRSWIDAVYCEVLAEMYPGLTFRPMSDNMITVILNSLSNCRYQDLVRLRDPVKDFFKLIHPATEQERQENEEKVDAVYPNLFHGVNSTPDIHPYEGDVMPIALTVTFFYGPKAIGAMYPGLFEKTNDPKDERKHIAILAYLATMVQFVLSEWKLGYFKKGTLNANYLLSVYICHYEGLKKVTSRARERLRISYNEWFDKALASAQAPTIFKRKTFIQPVTRLEDIRPDGPRRSPTPDGTTQTAPAAPSPSQLPIGVSYMAPASPGPSRLSARASRRYSPLALHPRHTPSHRSPTSDVPYIAPFSSPRPLRLSSLPRNQSPTPERDAEGRFTSRAKAKGHAMD